MKPYSYGTILVFAISLLIASPVIAEKLANLSSGYCLDTDGRAVNGGVVRMWNCATHPNQTWTVEQVDATFYRLINQSSKFCLDTDGSKQNDAQVRMWECANHPNQLWEIDNLPENHYRFKNKASGFCLDTDGRATNGGIVRMRNCETHPNQSWLSKLDWLPFEQTCAALIDDLVAWRKTPCQGSRCNIVFYHMTVMSNDRFVGYSKGELNEYNGEYLSPTLYPGNVSMFFSDRIRLLRDDNCTGDLCVNLQQPFDATKSDAFAFKIKKPGILNLDFTSWNEHYTINLSCQNGYIYGFQPGKFMIMLYPAKRYYQGPK